MGRLENKVALITGAARGHAEAMARRFAAEGADIAMCDIVPVDELESTTGEAVRATGRRALCVKTDVSDEGQVNDLVERTMAKFGKIDILAPVVGIAGPTKDLHELTLSEWRQVQVVNVDSAFLCCKAVLPHMIERRAGRIILYSSPTGKQPLAHRSSYATSKMAIIGLTRTLAAEVGRHLITVNAICPGGHPARDVELTQAFNEYTGQTEKNSNFSNYPAELESNRVIAGHWLVNEGYLQDHGTSEDAAAVAVFIASDEASHFTGQDVNTPGGYVMW